MSLEMGAHAFHPLVNQRVDDALEVLQGNGFVPVLAGGNGGPKSITLGSKGTYVGATSTQVLWAPRSSNCRTIAASRSPGSPWRTARRSAETSWIRPSTGRGRRTCRPLHDGPCGSSSNSGGPNCTRSHSPRIEAGRELNFFCGPAGDIRLMSLGVGLAERTGGPLGWLWRTAGLFFRRPRQGGEARRGAVPEEAVYRGNRSMPYSVPVAWRRWTSAS